MTRTASFLFLIAMISTSPTAAVVQELVPLEDAINAGAEDSYPLVRCAGFHYSTIEYAGTDTFEPEARSNVETTIERFMDAAVLLRAVNGIEADVSSQQVVQEVSAISDLYVVRYQKNYAMSGQAFGADPLWASDAEICKNLSGVKKNG